ARARFVGISVPMHTALRLGLRVAEQIRRINPDCHICFYGLYASLNEDYLLQHAADSVIGGEYEEALVALVESLDAGVPPEADGVSTRARKAKPTLARLPFPLPVRNQLPPISRYARLVRGGEELPAGYVEASRGCLHLCTHCPIPPVYGGRFFVVPQDVVLEDIRRLAGSGARHITFGDPDFLNGPLHSLRLARAMHEEFPEITFDFTAKVEHILKHGGLLPELASLGCVFVVSAIESLSDTVLDHLEKGHTRSDIGEALRVLRGAGIALRPSFVSFTPWTTIDDYLDVMEFVEAEGLIDNVDPVQYTIRLLVPPGSLLLERAGTKRWLGRLVQESFSYEWAHPDPVMDELHRRVSGLVEESVSRNEDPSAAFYRIRDLALAARGDGGAPFRPALPADRLRPPRLSEAWFC
ncbi:MAG TPA: CUAEP/CCAEP-tail radical SAM protein, partial [Blastocatellia bacterium]|nr:CUAEP/CCAEP-tail radical SAM protein [Blastocatellia bacterium]